LWAGDGHSLVQVVNLQTNTIEATINTGGVNRADELAVGGGLILIANDAESDASGNPCPFLSFISRANHQVLAQVVYDGNAASCTREHTNTDAAGHSFPPPSNVKTTHQPYAATDGLEQPVWDPARRKFFQAVPLTNDAVGGGGEVDELDPGSMTVVKRFTLGSTRDECHPQGLVLGLHGDLWAGCNPGATSATSGPRAFKINPDLPGANAVVDSEKLRDPNGNVLPNGAGPDEIWLNPGDHRLYLASSGAANLAVIDVDTVEQVDSVTTATGSHSVAADSVRNLIYVPENAAGCPPNGCLAVYESGGRTTPVDNDNTSDGD
jgi:DNA-binding beta-propeller fold protein YncE